MASVQSQLSDRLRPGRCATHPIIRRRCDQAKAIRDRLWMTHGW